MTSRSWCFTAWKAPAAGWAATPKMAYAIYQKEVAPETKKIHWQGYVEFEQPVRMTAVKKAWDDTTMHLEKRKGSRSQARDYCRKKDTAEGEPVETGIWKEDHEGQGRRTDIEMMHDDIKAGDSVANIAENYPAFIKYHRGVERAKLLIEGKKIPNWRNVTVKVLHGKPGSGKTRWVYENNKSIYTLLSCSPLWFDGYQGEECLLIDDFDGGIEYRTLLRILDGYKMQVPVKGGSVWANWTTVCITCNKRPEVWYSGELWAEGALKRRVNTGGMVTFNYLNRASPVTEVGGNTEPPLKDNEIEEIVNNLT